MYQNFSAWHLPVVSIHEARRSSVAQDVMWPLAVHSTDWSAQTQDIAAARADLVKRGVLSPS